MQCSRKSEMLLKQTYSQWAAHRLTARCSLVRSLFSKTGIWENRFSEELRQELEEYWRNRINEPYKSNTEGRKDKYYVLSMFPYPSGNLHMGHVRVYTISDTMARYHKMRDREVIHPMGWDAFGMPAENAAIERGVQPDEWTRSNITSMKKQLTELGLSFDWNREYATCDADYYKWTQYIFLKMYDAGLVYQKDGEVNWDPVDNTVLADEQIDEHGRSWRSGAKAEKRFLTQWYIRTTAYAKSLFDGLSEVNPDLWCDIINMQKHWIGECTGARLHLQVQDADSNVVDTLDVFTDNPELVFGTSHILLSERHKLNQSKYVQVDQDGEDKRLNVCAIHPFTKKKIPLFISKTNKFGEFSDTLFGIPSICEEAQTFAESHGLSYSRVIDSDSDLLINSQQFSGLSRKEGFEQLTMYAKENGFGGYITSEKLRDWLISRQRYWGTPIPMIHCRTCGAVPVPYEDLPVKLPKIAKLTGKGGSPLTDAKDWLNVPCPRCNGEAHRETDTMDTFVDSSWYFLRYLDPQNTEVPFDPQKAKQFMPVDLYIGGKEHAIMHLYYARFFSHFLHDAGMVAQREPFVNLLTQGMVKGKTYRLKSTGEYLKTEDVEVKGKKAYQKDTGAEVTMNWEKMSKSKHNGVDPQEVVNTYGVDATRLCILSNVAPKTNRNWSNDTFIGILRWRKRIWDLVSHFMTVRSENLPVTLTEDVKKHDVDLSQKRNFYTKEITFHYEKTFLLNTAISRLQSFSTYLKKFPDEVIGNSLEYEKALRVFLILMAPLAPSVCSELWRGLQSKGHTALNYPKSDIFSAVWPQVDQDYKLPLVVKRDTVILMSEEYSRAEMENMSAEEVFCMVKNLSLYEERIAQFNITDIEYKVETGFQGTLQINSDGFCKKEDKEEIKAIPFKKTVVKIV